MRNQNNSNCKEVEYWLKKGGKLQLLVVSDNLDFLSPRYLPLEHFLKPWSSVAFISITEGRERLFVINAGFWALP